MSGPRKSCFWWVFPIALCMALAGFGLIVFGQKLGMGGIMAGMMLCVFAVAIMALGGFDA